MSKHNVDIAQLTGVRHRLGEVLDRVLQNARYTTSDCVMNELNAAFELIRKADYAIIRAMNLSR